MLENEGVPLQVAGAAATDQVPPTPVPGMVKSNVVSLLTYAPFIIFWAAVKILS